MFEKMRNWIIPEKNRKEICKYNFQGDIVSEGVCYAKKDFNLAKHPDIDVPNLQVIKLMQSFKSKEYVRETFAWMHYYWFLTNDGIEFLRTYLNLPSEIVPIEDFRMEGDAILVAPEDGKVKPSVTIIKDIFQIEGGELMVSAQRFFRPEEAEKKEGGTWKSGGARELFYNCQLDEIPANSVMHKCVIHLMPLLKPLPDRRQQPGFIVRKFYDNVNLKARSLTEKDCKTVRP